MMSWTLNPVVAGGTVGCTPLRAMHPPWSSLVRGNERPITWIWMAYSDRTFRQGVKIFDTHKTCVRAQYASHTAAPLKRKVSL